MNRVKSWFSLVWVFFCGGLSYREKDLKLRMKFAKDIKKYYDDGLWLSGICFYLDTKDFIHKINLMEQAKAPKSLVWRKKTEGLITGCTSKVAKSRVFLLQYHLAKRFTIVSITRSLVVKYLLNLLKTTLLRFSKVDRPDQLDFLFCEPACMVFFSNWNKIITKKIPENLY